MRRSVGSICRSSRATDRAVGCAVLRKNPASAGFFLAGCLFLVRVGSGWSRRALAPCCLVLEWVGQPGPGPAVNPSMGARSAASMPHTVPDRATRPTPDRFVGGRQEEPGLPLPTRCESVAKVAWVPRWSGCLCSGARDIHAWRESTGEAGAPRIAQFVIRNTLAPGREAEAVSRKPAANSQSQALTANSQQPTANSQQPTANS